MKMDSFQREVMASGTLPGYQRRRDFRVQDN
jgi:hypothetical protein